MSPRVTDRLAAAALLAVLSACATAPPTKDYSRLAAARPRSILIVPVMNKSVDVNAADYFLSTVSVPVAERGYYVFPVNMVKRVLEDDGLADAGMVHGADPMRLAALFDADAVLYVSIDRWDARYIVLSTQVTVAFEYVLKDGNTGETLWADRETQVYTSDSGGGQGGLAALVAAAVSAAVTKAAPNYMPLARQANARAMAYPGPGIPAGPYRAEHASEYAAVVARPAQPAQPPPKAPEQVPPAQPVPASAR